MKLDAQGRPVIFCVECRKWILAEEYAYGHDCEEDK